MIAYFDTSALIPLLIDEPATPQCTAAWNAAEFVASSLITYLEVHAALAQAARLRRIDADRHATALLDFDGIWGDMLHIPLDEDLVQHAALLSARHALRGYDAVQCASAVSIASEDLSAVSGDQDLLHAWSELGLATIDTAR